MQRDTGANGIACDVVAHFTDETCNLIWNELGVVERNWDEWHDRVQSERRHFPIIDGLNEISMLAYILEGSVHFKPEKLLEDCDAAMPIVKSAATRAMVSDLRRAAEAALKIQDADVVVHPFGI